MDFFKKLGNTLQGKIFENLLKSKCHFLFTVTQWDQKSFEVAF